MGAFDQISNSAAETQSTAEGGSPSAKAARPAERQTAPADFPRGGSDAAQPGADIPSRLSDDSYQRPSSPAGRTNALRESSTGQAGNAGAASFNTPDSPTPISGTRGIDSQGNQTLYADNGKNYQIKEANPQNPLGSLQEIQDGKPVGEPTRINSSNSSYSPFEGEQRNYNALKPTNTPVESGQGNAAADQLQQLTQQYRTTSAPNSTFSPQSYSASDVSATRSSSTNPTPLVGRVEQNVPINNFGSTSQVSDQATVLSQPPRNGADSRELFPSTPNQSPERSTPAAGADARDGSAPTTKQNVADTVTNASSLNATNRSTFAGDQSQTPAARTNAGTAGGGDTVEKISKLDSRVDQANAEANSVANRKAMGSSQGNPETIGDPVNSTTKATKDLTGTTSTSSTAGGGGGSDLGGKGKTSDIVPLEGKRPLTTEGVGGAGKGVRGEIPGGVGGLELPDPRAIKDQIHGPRHLDGHLALELRNPKTREMLIDLIGKFQSGKLEVHGEKAIRLNAAMKALGPENLAILQHMLEGTRGNAIPRLDLKFDLHTQGKVKDVLDAMKDLMGIKPTRTEALVVKTPAERLLDFLKTNDKLVTGKIPTPETSKLVLLELGRILRDYNLELGLQPGKGALTLKDILGRNFEPVTKSAQAGMVAGETFKIAKVDVLTDHANVAAIIAAATKAAINPVVNPAISATEKGEVPSAKAKVTDVSAVDATAPANPLARPTVQGAAAENAETGSTNKFASVKEDELTEEEKAKAKSKEKEITAKPLDEAAFAAALAARKLKETKEKAQKDQTSISDKKDDEARRKYIVKKGDTLESIAGKIFRDKRLAGLIYEINKSIIPARDENGKKYVYLTPKLVIYLPSKKERSSYRAQLLSGNGIAEFAAVEYDTPEEELKAKYGNNWSSTIDGDKVSVREEKSVEEMHLDAATAAQNRKINVEKVLGPVTPAVDERAKYVVRLGDTLKSISMKHPALRNLALWKLLASVNGMPTETDEKGNPLAVLTRGMVISVPRPDEIAGYHAYDNATTFGKKKVEQPPVFVSEEANQLLKVVGSNSFAMPATGVEAIQKLDESARIVRVGTQNDLDAGFKARLEVLINSAWMPVISYEIYSDVALRHEFNTRGVLKTYLIELPSSAAIELTNNDLSFNWQGYREKYLLGQSMSG